MDTSTGTDTDTTTDTGVDSDAGADSGAEPDSGGDPELPPSTVAECFADAYLNPAMEILGMDYDQFSPVIGSHCVGTNHQDIVDVERVVFLGDSITVGSPPALATQFYRARLADKLAQHFSLQKPSALWKNANPVDGTASVRTSGDFSSCAEWGARTDDFLQDGTQIEDCFPEDTRDKTTLVIATMGGNDVSSVVKDGLDDVPLDDVWDRVYEFVDLMRQAVAWFYEEPGMFPAGVYVVFGNVYEFTDGTGLVTSCPASSLGGFSGNWEDPSLLADMVVWANEQYLSFAVEFGVDMVFMLEHFCGHGYKRNDSDAPCYRGPGNALWFDVTCIHPNAAGHSQLANIFMSVIEE